MAVELKIIQDKSKSGPKPPKNKKFGKKKKGVKKWEFALVGGTAFSIALWLFMVTGCLIIIADPVLNILLGSVAVAWLQFISVSTCGVLTIFLMGGLVLINAHFLPFRSLVSASVFTSMITLIFLTVFDFVLFEMFSVRALVTAPTNLLFQGSVVILRLMMAASLALLFFFLLISLLDRAYKAELNNKGYLTPIISIVFIFCLDAFYWFMFGVSILVPLSLGGAP